MYFQQLKTSLLSLLILSALTGLLYPLVVTGASQVLFSGQANGSLIYAGGKPVGSALIGQPFDDPKYFWSRLSATGPVSYNASGSSGSNLGPTNPALVVEVQGRMEALRKIDPTNKKPIPVDLVTSSASGLDPHISPAAAQYQCERIARARGLSADVVQGLIQKNTQSRFLGLLGETGVNVLKLNLALDQKK